LKLQSVFSKALSILLQIQEGFGSTKYLQSTMPIQREGLYTKSFLKAAQKHQSTKESNPPEQCLYAAAAHVKSFSLKRPHTDQVIRAHVVNLRGFLAVD
jgi:hypothetical protein